MLSEEQIRANVLEVKNRIAQAKRNSLAQEITLVVASKTVSAEQINLLPKLGITIAGENRADELVQKYPYVNGIEWHFIGALQTNKVKKIIDKVTLIHSVDRCNLVDEIQKASERIEKITNILVEINVGREPQKSGVLPENAQELIEYAKTKNALKVAGIMTVMPKHATEELYEQMQWLHERIKNDYGASILSMGMSGDYEMAIKYGANMVRLGSAIFGERNNQKR